MKANWTRLFVLPNLAWHDGTPLSAEDFVFSWWVFTTPELGQANLPPFTSIDEVLAPDDRTLHILWKRPYPDAAALVERDREFPPLPRHLLQAPLAAGDRDAFIGNPFWARIASYAGMRAAQSKQCRSTDSHSDARRS